MRTSIRLLSSFMGLILSVACWADTQARPAHYKGEPAESTQQAVSNLKLYNPKLEAILMKGELTAMDMNEVHQLTYTLENALQRLHADLEVIAAQLEEVHLASETGKPDVVQARGRAYLEGVRALVN